MKFCIVNGIIVFVKLNIVPEAIEVIFVFITVSINCYCSRQRTSSELKWSLFAQINILLLLASKVGASSRVS